MGQDISDVLTAQCDSMHAEGPERRERLTSKASTGEHITHGYNVVLETIGLYYSWGRDR